MACVPRGPQQLRMALALALVLALALALILLLLPAAAAVGQCLERAWPAGRLQVR